MFPSSWEPEDIEDLASIEYFSMMFGGREDRAGFERLWSIGFGSEDSGGRSSEFVGPVSASGFYERRV